MGSQGDRLTVPGDGSDTDGWRFVAPLRALVGARHRTATRTTLSTTRYAALTGLGVGLAGVQLLLLPRWLTAREFGLVVLSISVTQAMLQFGDLGISRLCIDATRSPADRRRLRAQGQALSLLAAVVVVLVAALVGALAPGYRSTSVVLALGALAGAAVASDKYRATTREVGGDEVGAAGLNFLWTNAPKIGLLVGLVVFRSAIGVVATSVIIGAILCAPYWSSPRHAVAALRDAPSWAYPSIAVVGSFVLMWADTYFVSAHLGVAEAGSYEALYRMLGICTYLFLPWTSVVASRVSVSEPRPLLRPLLLSLAVTAASLAAVVVFVFTAAADFFPHLELPRHAVVPLVAYYLLLPVSYCLGSALYVRAQTTTVTRAVMVSVAVCLVGHVTFTLRGGPAHAATVSAVAMAVAVAVQTEAYRRVIRSPSVAAGG